MPDTGRLACLGGSARTRSPHEHAVQLVLRAACGSAFHVSGRTAVSLHVPVTHRSSARWDLLLPLHSPHINDNDHPTSTCALHCLLLRGEHLPPRRITPVLGWREQQQRDARVRRLHLECTAKEPPLPPEGGGPGAGLRDMGLSRCRSYCDASCRICWRGTRRGRGREGV